MDKKVKMLPVPLSKWRMALGIKWDEKVNWFDQFGTLQFVKVLRYDVRMWSTQSLVSGSSAHSALMRTRNEFPG